MCFGRASLIPPDWSVPLPSVSQQPGTSSARAFVAACELTAIVAEFLPDMIATRIDGSSMANESRAQAHLASLTRTALVVDRWRLINGALFSPDQLSVAHGIREPDLLFLSCHPLASSLFWLTRASCRTAPGSLGMIFHGVGLQVARAVWDAVLLLTDDPDLVTAEIEHTQRGAMQAAVQFVDFVERLSPLDLAGYWNSRELHARPMINLNGIRC